MVTAGLGQGDPFSPLALADTLVIVKIQHETSEIKWDQANDGVLASTTGTT